MEKTAMVELTRDELRALAFAVTYTYWLNGAKQNRPSDPEALSAMLLGKADLLWDGAVGQ